VRRPRPWVGLEFVVPESWDRLSEGTNQRTSKQPSAPYYYYYHSYYYDRYNVELILLVHNTTHGIDAVVRDTRLDTLEPRPRPAPAPAPPTAEPQHKRHPPAAAAQRPSPSPLQPRSATQASQDAAPPPAASAVASPRSVSFSLPTLCCCRCRRENGHASMFQFGKNLYYCSHCARMVGYVGE
jgi:hypothetical protein